MTHRLGEVFELARRVTVIRNGRSFDAVETRSLDVERLIEMMLGRRLDQMFPARAESPGDVVLAVENCLCPGLSAPVSFTVRRGEMLGLAGQSAAAPTPSSKRSPSRAIQQGRIVFQGRPFTPRTIRESIAAGIAYCSDDRKRDGVFAVRNLVENLTAPTLRAISRGGLIDRAAEGAHARTIAQQFDVDVNRLDRLAGHLSGGNQQKVALGKWIGLAPSLLLVEEPTRGVDVGARAEIYRHLRAQTERGLAVLFASSDTHEVLGLSDRIGTFFHGRLVGLAPAQTMTAESVTRAVTHPDLAA